MNVDSGDEAQSEPAPRSTSLSQLHRKPLDRQRARSAVPVHSLVANLRNQVTFARHCVDRAHVCASGNESVRMRSQPRSAKAWSERSTVQH